MGKKILLGAIGIVVVIVGAFLILGIAPQTMAADIRLDFVDENGENIPIPYAFYIGETEVMGFKSTVTHQIVGTEYKLTTLYVDGTLEFWSQAAGRDTDLKLLDTHTWVNRNPSGSHEHIWYFPNWLNTAEASQWSVNVVASLEGTVEDAYGQEMSDVWEGGYSFTVSWSADAGTFSISGTVVGPANVP